MKLIALILLSCALPASSQAANQCSKNESVIFDCITEHSRVSLCESKKDEALVYRATSHGIIRLQVSEPSENKGNIFFLSSTPYAGGGESHIRFTNADHTYYLYEKNVKSDDGPIFSSGIVIYHHTNRIFDLNCKNNASIHQEAYTRIAPEPYIDIQSK